MNRALNVGLERGTQTRIATSRHDNLFFDVALFSIGALDAFYIRLAGQLYFSDLLVPFFMTAALFARGLPSSRIIHGLLFGMACWMVAQVSADILNQTSTANYLRGWSRNGLAIAYLVFFLCALRPTAQSIAMLVCGLAVGLFLQAILVWHGLTNLPYLMKFGGAAAGTWLLCVFSTYAWQKKSPILPFVGIAGWMAFALSENVRSAMTDNFILLGLMAASYYGHRFFRRVSLPALFVTILVCGGVAGFGLWSGYDYVATNGFLGKAAANKHLSERGSGGLSEIWNARPEIRVALAVVADSPILGHGSWYSDPKISAAQLLFSSYADTSLSTPEALRSYIIQSNGVQTTGHSAIMQAWVESGIVGAIVWFGIICICMIGILRSLQRPTPLSPLLFYAAILLIWDSLFSPFAGAQRVSNMAELAIILLVMPPSSRAMNAIRANTVKLHTKGLATDRPDDRLSAAPTYRV